MQNDVFNIQPKKAPPEIFPEPFNDSDVEGGMQTDVFNIQPEKASPEIFPERFNNSDDEGEMQNDASNIPPKKAPWRLSLSDSTTSMAKGKCKTMFSVSSPRKLHCRFSPRRSATDLARRSAQLVSVALRFVRSVTDHPRLRFTSDSTTVMTKMKCATMFSISLQRKPHRRGSASESGGNLVWMRKWRHLCKGVFCRQNTWFGI